MCNMLIFRKIQKFFKIHVFEAFLHRNFKYANLKRVLVNKILIKCTKTIHIGTNSSFSLQKITINLIFAIYKTEIYSIYS